MKFVVATLLAALLLLQYRLWVSDEGMREVWHLRQAVENQVAENAVLAERNAQMKAEVADLKQGLTAVEERARNDLGMIAANETFYQVVDATHLAPDGEPATPASMQAQYTPQ
jgi:cell division protein FtsB